MCWAMIVYGKILKQSLESHANGQQYTQVNYLLETD